MHLLWAQFLEGLACPVNADTAGRSIVLSALVKIKVTHHWEYSCMHSATKFILLNRWKKFPLKFSDNIMTVNLEAFKHTF